MRLAGPGAYPGDRKATCLGCGLKANGTHRGFTLEVLETHHAKCYGNSERRP